MRYIVSVCILLLCVSCASVNVSYNFDPEADFSKIKTYDWAHPSEKSKDDELTIKQIRNAVNEQLRIKGISRSETSPDVLVAIHTKTKRRESTEQWGYEYFDYDFSQYRQGVDKYEYDIRTVVLDMIEPEQMTLIWRGAASAEVDYSDPASQLHEMVAGIFTKYPPR